MSLLIHWCTVVGAGLAVALVALPLLVLGTVWPCE